MPPLIEVVPALDLFQILRVDRALCESLHYTHGRFRRLYYLERHRASASFSKPHAEVEHRLQAEPFDRGDVADLL